ncbi:MAG: hypothetical protein P8L88_02890 [Paracoccaceae bacterium]|nr:hypothetical protein [Paracoccaceae bacterium]
MPQPMHQTKPAPNESTAPVLKRPEVRGAGCLIRGPRGQSCALNSFGLGAVTPTNFWQGSLTILATD